LSSFKKVELHLHLDGSIRIKTLKELGIEYGFLNPCITDTELLNKVSVNSSDNSLHDYLEKFNLPIKILQSEYALERVSFELVEDLFFEDTIYAEIRIAPIQHLNKGLKPSDVIDSILKGLKRGMNKYQIKVNLILCAMRHISIDENLFLIDLAYKYKNNGVVGLDLAGDESQYPVSLFRDFFFKAKQLNIPFTIHAGEGLGPESIIEAINLGAKRIGHGIRAYEDDKVVELLINEKVCLECCPKSNIDTRVFSSLENYPFKYYFDKGIKVTLNSDNRTVSRTNLNNELRLLKEFYTISDNQLQLLNINALEYAFISKKEKEILLNIIMGETYGN